MGYGQRDSKKRKHALVLMFGVWYGYSVFLVTLLREFGWSRSLVAGAFSTFVLVHGLLGPVIGWLVRRFGPRRLIMVGAILMASAIFLMAETTQWWHLYLAFGVLAAFAMSLSGWIPSVVLVGGWFPDRIGTAIGIMGSGRLSINTTWHDARGNRSRRPDRDRHQAPLRSPGSKQTRRRGEDLV